MGRHCVLFVIAIAMAQAMPLAARAAGSCVPSEQPSPPPAAGTPKSFVRMQLVDPANGGAVDAGSVLVVDVDYAVADFEPGQYGLMVYFSALVSFTSPAGPEGRYELPRGSGRVRLCVPLRDIYAAPRLRWPLQMYVSLNKRQENVSPKFSAMFAPVANSERVSLNSVAPPRETERRQADAVDDMYRDAVTVVTGMIVNREAAGLRCSQVPELEVEFTAAHRGWMSRNQPVIDHVSTLQRDLYARDIGRQDIVDEIMNLHTTGALNRLDEMPADKLRSYCLQQSRAFSDPRSDLETAAAAQLAVMRAHAPARPVGRK
jgi:hypothetical protein